MHEIQKMGNFCKKMHPQARKILCHNLQKRIHTRLLYQNQLIKYFSHQSLFGQNWSIF